MPNSSTTIKISKTLHDELAKLGSKGDTFQEIIQRLVKGAHS